MKKSTLIPMAFAAGLALSACAESPTGSSSNNNGSGYSSSSRAASSSSSCDFSCRWTECVNEPSSAGSGNAAGFACMARVSEGAKIKSIAVDISCAFGEKNTTKGEIYIQEKEKNANGDRTLFVASQGQILHATHSPESFVKNGCKDGYNYLNAGGSLGGITCNRFVLSNVDQAACEDLAK